MISFDALGQEAHCHTGYIAQFSLLLVDNLRGGPNIVIQLSGEFQCAHGLAIQGQVLQIDGLKGNPHIKITLEALDGDSTPYFAHQHAAQGRNSQQQPPDRPAAARKKTQEKFHFASSGNFAWMALSSTANACSKSKARIASSMAR